MGVRLNALTYSKLPPQQRESRAVERGVRIHGEKYRTELDSSFSVAWHRMPHLESAWSWGVFGSPAYTLLNQPRGRVYFAGDWLTWLVTWQAGAFDSALRVVTELHWRVLKS